MVVFFVIYDEYFFGKGATENSKNNRQNGRGGDFCYFAF